MLCFVLSSVHALFAPYASSVQKPIRFCPERDLSQYEQRQFAKTAVTQWVKDAGPGIIYVFTHSEHFVQAAQLAILQGEISPNQVSAIYLFQEDEKVCEHHMTFTVSGHCIPWPPFFWRELLETSSEVAQLRAENKRTSAPIE